jgi:hypothetical protein
MATIEYLRVQKPNSSDYFGLIAILEESKNDYYSRYVVEMIPLTRTSMLFNDPLTSRYNLFPPQFSFDLELNHTNKTAEFATRRNVMLPEALRGCGVGSYAFSRLIEWGQSLQPTYRVEKLKLAQVDAQTNETRDQRNGFYEKHGFEFSFSDPDHRTGSCFAESLAHLQPGINSDKVSLLDLFDEMSNLITSNEKFAKEIAVKKLAYETCCSRKQELINEKIHLKQLLFIVFVIFVSIVAWRY